MFKRIHTETYFKTLVVYSLEKKLEIEHKGKNIYSIYYENSEKSFILNLRQILFKLNTIENILFIKIQAMVCNLNFYGYPEIIQIKV